MKLTSKWESKHLPNVFTLLNGCCRFFKRLVTRYQHSRTLDKLRGHEGGATQSGDEHEGDHGENEEGQGSQTAGAVQGGQGEGAQEDGNMTDQR